MNDTLTASGSRKASKPFSSRHAASPLQNIGSFVRSRLRQLLVPLLFFICLVVYLSRNRNDSNSSMWSVRQEADPATEGVYKVDRDALAKLNKLEKYWAKEEDEAARSKREAAGEEHTPLPREETVDPDEERYVNRQTEKLPGQVPLVDHIPEPPKIPKVIVPPAGPVNPTPPVPAAELDAQFCPGQESCKFLIPAFIGEQETKGQQHLYQMGLLAASLNRTLVLTNVIRSRIGSCYANPFSFYYSPDSLQNLGFNTITQTQMLSWAAQRDPPPTAQIIAMGQPKPDYPAGAIEIDSTSDPSLVPGRAERKLCLTPPKSWLNFADFSPLAVFPGTGWHKTEPSRMSFGEGVINTLRSPEVALKSSRLLTKQQQKDLSTQIDTPDALVVNFELRYPILSTATLEQMSSEAGNEYLASASQIQPFSHFPYSTTWIDLATSLASNLKPYIAIHWRQETLPVDNLSACTDALLEVLRDIAAQYPTIQTVYLATDYPIEDLEAGHDGMVAHSGTFARLITEDHHRAMRALLNSFRTDEVGGLKLTTYEREQKAGRLSLPESAEEGTHVDLAQLDSGLLGIVDKTVAMQAEVFVTGSAGICGKESSFTRQIIADRKAKMDLAEEEKVEGQDALAEGEVWESVRHFTLPELEVKEDPEEPVVEP